MKLETIKTSITVLHERHEEVMREKESKILALQFQHIASTTEKASQDEKVKRLEEEKAELGEEVISLKEENKILVEINKISSVVIENNDRVVRDLRWRLTVAEKGT